MKIIIESYYDGFAVLIDGERFSISQEETQEALVEAFKLANPEAEVIFEECY